MGTQVGGPEQKHRPLIANAPSGDSLRWINDAYDRAILDRWVNNACDRPVLGWVNDAFRTRWKYMSVGLRKVGLRPACNDYYRVHFSFCDNESVFG